jgi:hypothetical protein
MRNQIQNVNTEKPISLYHLVSEYQDLFRELYDPETGEINELVQAKIDAKEPDVQKKCIAVGQWIKSIEKEKREIEYMKEQILARESAYEKEINKWQYYLKMNMERFGVTKVSSPFFTLEIKKNPYSTDILDATKIPNKFMATKEIVKVEIKPDKNAIKEEVLKTGEQVEGAYVGQKTRLVISVDKI